jgi:hypothetical protein
MTSFQGCHTRACWSGKRPPPRYSGRSSTSLMRSGRIHCHRAYGFGIEEEADPHSWLVACVQAGALGFGVEGEAAAAATVLEVGRLVSGLG